MLHEFSGSRSQLTSVLAQSHSSVNPLYSSTLPSNRAQKLWETSVNCATKSSSIALPEISEFLREETASNQQPVLPFCGSFVKFLELDDSEKIKGNENQDCPSENEIEDTNFDAKRQRLEKSSSNRSKISNKRNLHSGQEKGKTQNNKTKTVVKSCDEISSCGSQSNKDATNPTNLTNPTNNLGLSSAYNAKLALKDQNYIINSSSVSDHNNNINTNNNIHAIPQVTYTNLLFDDGTTNPQTHLAPPPIEEIECEVPPDLNQLNAHNFGVCYSFNGNQDNKLPITCLQPSESNPSPTITNDFLQLCNNRGLYFNDCYSAMTYKDVQENHQTCIESNCPENLEHVKTEQKDSASSFYPLNNRNLAHDLREIPWIDAPGYLSKERDNNRAQLSINNSLLEDVDLSGVDNACMEQFEREYQQKALKETEHACSVLNIPIDAQKWSEFDVDKWIMWIVHQCNLPTFNISNLRMSGAKLCMLGEAEMLSRVPTCGDIIHARLSIWKSASKIIENQSKSVDKIPLAPSHISDTLYATKLTGTSPIPGTVQKQANEMSESDNSAQLKPPHTSSIHLWMFLKELLLQPQLYGQFIRWIDQDEGIFKIEDSMEVARLWGVRKNRPAMNYDKLSRSIRQYYKKGIIKKTPVSQRLVYQFVNPSLTLSI